VASVAAPSPKAAAAGQTPGGPPVRLRYSRLDEPGIRRLRRGKGFRYLDPSGRPITDSAALARLRGLAVPPAWEEVWICPDESGHIQAFGRDARGRKQYRYHPAWRARRDRRKYARLVEFGAALPRIRRWVAEDLRRRGLPREKVLAAMVRLLDETLIRVGNREYVRANQSYGLSTLRSRHVRVRGNGLHLRFRGKGGQMQEAAVRDPRLATVIRHLQDLPGQPLFEYRDGTGAVRSIASDDLNAYLRRIARGDFTARDFRTWGATLTAFAKLAGEAPETVRERRRALTEAIAAAADRLGDTTTVARSSYVAPQVVDAFEAGDLTDLPKVGDLSERRDQLERELRRALRRARPARRREQRAPG
jgi:DNA topoisomerase-1